MNIWLFRLMNHTIYGFVLFSKLFLLWMVEKKVTQFLLNYRIDANSSLNKWFANKQTARFIQWLHDNFIEIFRKILNSRFTHPTNCICHTVRTMNHSVFINILNRFSSHLLTRNVSFSIHEMIFFGLFLIPKFNQKK